MSGFFAVLTVVAILVAAYAVVGAVVGAVVPLPLVRTRKRQLYVFLSSGVAVVVCVMLAAVMREEPIALTPEQEQQHLEMVEAKAAERYKRLAASERERELSRSSETTAAPREPDSNDDAECRKTLDCWGTKHATTAAVRCKAPVELLAKNDFEWTDGLLDQKFTRYKWKNEATGEVTYIGDKIKFQNGFGAWIFHTYECDLDASGEEVTDVRASPGRIGQ